MVYYAHVWCLVTEIMHDFVEKRALICLCQDSTHHLRFWVLEKAMMAARRLLLAEDSFCGWLKVRLVRFRTSKVNWWAAPWTRAVLMRRRSAWRTVSVCSRISGETANVWCLREKCRVLGIQRSVGGPRRRPPSPGCRCWGCAPWRTDIETLSSSTWSGTDPMTFLLLRRTSVAQYYKIPVNK